MKMDRNFDNGAKLFPIEAEWNFGPKLTKKNWFLQRTVKKVRKWKLINNSHNGTKLLTTEGIDWRSKTLVESEN